MPTYRWNGTQHVPQATQRWDGAQYIPQHAWRWTGTQYVPIDESDDGGGDDSPPWAVLPVGNLPGWTQTMAEDFTTPAALGQFMNVYGATYSAYEGWEDTSRELGRPVGRRGQYNSTRTVTVANSVLDIHVHTDGVQPYVFALTPFGLTGQLYGRFAVRFRSQLVEGYKIAWLTWPTSNDWVEGEIDFPEAGLGQMIHGFSHQVGGNPNINQWNINTGMNMLDWHTAIIEWEPNRLRFILDETVYQTTDPQAIPTTPMRWCLQTETWLSGTPPPTASAGHVEIDWVAVWNYTP